MSITLNNGDVLNVTTLANPNGNTENITINSDGSESVSPRLPLDGNLYDISITATVNGEQLTTDLGNYSNYAISDQGYLFLSQKAYSPPHQITFFPNGDITNSDPEASLYVYDYYNNQYYQGSSGPIATATIPHFYLTDPPGGASGTDYAGNLTWSDFDAISYVFDNNPAPVTQNSEGITNYNFDYQNYEVKLTPRLFEPGTDNVNFNSSDQYAAIRDGAEIFHGLGGNDVVWLPDEANYGTLGWTDTAASTFYTGSQVGNTYTVNGGDGSYYIVCGAGSDKITISGNGNSTIVEGAGTASITINGNGSNSIFLEGSGNDTIVGGSGADTFNSTPLITAGAQQTITSTHKAFQTATSVQDTVTLVLPSNDYTFTVSFSSDTFAGTQTQITPTAASGLPSFTLITTGVERASFSGAITNVVNLTDGNVAAEMLQLASESYSPNYSTLSLANIFGSGVEPLAYQTTGTPSEVAAAIRNHWQAVSAMEFGMASADFKQGSLQYSFSNGVYQAINPSDTFLGKTAEADALVLTGLVNGKATLAISFRGTDQIADFGDYSNFNTYYQDFAPLVSAIKAYLAANNGITQVLVSGHSLGAAAVDYFMENLPNTAAYSVEAYTDGSPGV